VAPRFASIARPGGRGTGAKPVCRGLLEATWIRWWSVWVAKPEGTRTSTAKRGAWRVARVNSAPAPPTRGATHAMWGFLPTKPRRNGARCAKRGPTPPSLAAGKVVIVHVGGPRCVTFSTDNIRNIHARITWTVEVIRTCMFVFVCGNTRTSMNQD
jgi:hypothetical protein